MLGNAPGWSILQQTNLDALIADQAGLDLLSDRVLESAPRRILFGPGAKPSRRALEFQGTSFEGFAELPDEGPERPVFIAEDELAYIIFTSGTTGKPKGVMINSCDALLVDDFRERPQAAGKRRFLEQQAEKHIRSSWREASVEQVCFHGATVSFQIDVEAGANRIGGVKGKFGGTGLARQSALKDARIDAMKLDVGLQALECRWTRLDRVDADAFALTMKEHRR